MFLHNHNKTKKRQDLQLNIYTSAKNMYLLTLSAAR